MDRIKNETIDHPYPVPELDIPGMHIWGLVGPEELIWLIGKSGSMNSVAEIGCMHGRASYALLYSCKGSVYCIDPWDDANPELYLNPPGNMYSEFMKNCGHFSNLHAIRGKSPEAGKTVPCVDMVWIDGAHDYQSVLADLQFWGPKTAKLICGHDYGNPTCPGVKEAVDFYFGGWYKIETAPIFREPIWYVEVPQ